MSFQKHRQGSPKRSKAAESSFRASKCGSFVTWFGAGEFLYLFGIEMVVRDGKPRPMLTAQHAIGSFSKGGFGVTGLLSMVQQLQIYDLSEKRCLMSNPHALRHETYLESPGLYYMIMERPALQMRTVSF